MSINRIPLIAVVLATVAVSYPSRADENNRGGALGADAAAIVPVGNWKKGGANVGFGGLAYADHRLLGDLSLTLRAGYVYHLPKSDDFGKPSFHEILLLAGGKYRFDDFYVAAEVGIVWMTLHRQAHTIDVTGAGTTCVGCSRDFEEATYAERELGVTGGVGYELGNLDFRAQVLFPALGRANDYLGVMGTVGYRFVRF